MKTQKIISEINGNSLIHIFGEDNTYTSINYDNLSGDTISQSIINKYFELCDKLRRESKPVLEEPSAVGEPVYILQTPCPVDNTLIAKVYDTNYSNDKTNKVVRIDVRIIHYNQNGERVPQWDADTYIICDMSEDRKVTIPESNPVEYEYSYVLANTMLQNGMTINQLISMAIQLAEFETNSLFLERIYNQ